MQQTETEGGPPAAIQNAQGDSLQHLDIVTACAGSKTAVVIDPLQSDGYRHKLRHLMNVVYAVREMVHSEVIKVISCPTQRQLADIGTKILGKNIFGNLCSMIYPRRRPEVDHPP